MHEAIKCRCGHEKSEHMKDEGPCTVIVDLRELEEPATYCQCGEYFPVIGWAVMDRDASVLETKREK